MKTGETRIKKTTVSIPVSLFISRSCSEWLYLLVCIIRICVLQQRFTFAFLHNNNLAPLPFYIAGRVQKRILVRIIGPGTVAEAGRDAFVLNQGRVTFYVHFVPVVYYAQWLPAKALR